MKRSILISVYDMEIGGVERSLINMLNSFDYERFEVDLLVFSHQGDLLHLLSGNARLLPENKSYKIFRKSIAQCVRDGQYAAVFIRLFMKLVAGARARRLNLREGSGYIQLQLVSKYLSSLMPAIGKKYDAAISYAWPHDFMMKKVNADIKVAWIHTDYSNVDVDNRLDYAMWEQFDRIISISDACTDAFISQYPQLLGKMGLVENITSPAMIKEMANDISSEPLFDSDNFNILSVGRLSFVKGFDMAIYALKILKDKGYRNIKWYVIGFGGTEEELKLLIAEQKLEDNFILLGKKNNPYPYMSACDLYVQPSRYEGKAVSVTEAQILGKAVLITNYSTSASQVHHGINGYIADMSPEGIAEEIEQLFLSTEKRQELERHCSEQSFDNSYELEKLYNMIDGERAGKRQPLL